MYIFFVREFNDIDHITPIVWKMKQDDYPVAVYCLNPKYDLHHDYRLRFLRKQGVKVNYIFDEFGRALEARPDDGPSLTMTERCRMYKEAPPPDDWDCVYVPTTK